MTQAQLIVKYLEEKKDWTRAYDLRGKNTREGFLGHQADRRLRELARRGIIDHRINKGFAEYKCKLPDGQLL